MLSLLWLIPALPAAGFVLLVLLGRRLGRAGTAVVGAGSVGLATLVAFLVCGSFIVSPPAGDAYHQVLWTWLDVAGFAPAIGLYLDAVSVIWVLVITFVGFLIHLYSTEHMEHDEGYTRFFMYLNLFVFSMLVLVLADNLLLLYLGWEGVGLCSYLLISFWQKDPQNVYSGRKAFIVTRVGDTAMIAGLFLLFTQLGTLEIQPLLPAAEESWAPNSGVAIAAALLLLGGAVGKSAQVPLQTWLPDAMAGPSPVSALIHAATMVTAGVYLIARTNVLFEIAGDARLVVAIVGAVTLSIAGFSALVQHDLKRSLAYSTISQIGYMFLALGVARLGGGRVPLHDARLLQGSAVPRRRRDHRGAGRRARHLQDGRAAARAARRVLDLHHRRGRPRGAALRHRWLLQQGPHHRHEPRLGGRQPLVLLRLDPRRLRHGPLLVPPRLARVLRRTPHRGHAPAPLAPVDGAVRPRRALHRRGASSGCRRGSAGSTR